jgi:fructan beta-fructosidase
MNWGHSVSTDLFNWQDLSIALTPDNLGTIFSGSAVIDSFNTAGFKTGEELPMVAIYTSAGNTQSQSMAYSNDKGRNWTKYANNPVLPNPGINDFRDPKVSWYAPLKKWIMALATGSKISFYSSPDLKNWTFFSIFLKQFLICHYLTPFLRFPHHILDNIHVLLVNIHEFHKH